MKRLAIICILYGSAACTNETKKESTEKAGVFPVSSFFKEQIRKVDSLKLPTVKFVTSRRKSDTSAISLEEFHQLAQPFIDADISDPKLKDAYKETDFADQTLGNVTLT